MKETEFRSSGVAEYRELQVASRKKLALRGLGRMPDEPTIWPAHSATPELLTPEFCLRSSLS
jgi:hypothetical protein